MDKISLKCVEDLVLDSEDLVILELLDRRAVINHFPELFSEYKQYESVNKLDEIKFASKLDSFLDIGLAKREHYRYSGRLDRGFYYLTTIGNSVLNEVKSRIGSPISERLKVAVYESVA